MCFRCFGREFGLAVNRRFDRPHAKRIDTHTVACKLLCPCTGHGIYSRFRSGIVRHRCDRIGRHRGGDVQNVSFRRLYHRQAGLGKYHDGTHVDGEHLVVFLNLHFGKRCDGCPPGIVDKNVKTAIPLANDLNHRLYSGFRFKVGCQVSYPFVAGGSFLQGARRAPYNHHVCAFVCQTLCNGPSDTWSDFVV